MDTRLIKSGGMVIAVLALASGVTYAAFTSNAVTISASTLATGSAEIKLCQGDAAGGHTWGTTVTPALTLGNLAPAANTSDPGQELTVDKSILIGNDGGTLPASAAPFPGTCATYSGTAGSSDVILKMLPTVTGISCTGTGMDAQLELRFALANNDGTTEVADSGWKTLAAWGTNTSVMDQIGVSTDFTMNVNQVQKVKVFGRLKSTADTTSQGQSCTFDVVLTGKS